MAGEISNDDFAVSKLTLREVLGSWRVTVGTRVAGGDGDDDCMRCVPVESSFGGLLMRWGCDGVCGEIETRERRRRSLMLKY